MLVAFRRQPARRTAVVFGLGGLAKGRVRGHYKPSIGKFIPTYTTKRPEAMQAAGQLSMFGDTGEATEESPARSAVAWSEPASTYIGSDTSSAKIGDWQVYVTRPRFEEQFVFVAGRHQKPGSPKRRESGGGYATIEEARAAAVAATQTPDPERVPDTPEVAEYRAATKNLSPDTSNPRGARVFEAMKTLRPAVHAGDMDGARRMAQAALPVVQEAYEWAAGSEWANPKAQKSTVALYGRPLKYLEKLVGGVPSSVSKAVNPVAGYTRRGKSGQVVQVGGYTRDRRPGRGKQQAPAGPRVTMKPAKHASTSAEDLQKRYGKATADHHAYIGDRPVMLRQHGAGGKRGYAVYDGDGKLMATAHVQALPDGQGAALTATWTAPEAYGQQAHSPLLRRLVGEYGKVYSPHAVHADLWATVHRMGGDQGGGEFEAADEGNRKRLQRKAQAGLFDDEAVGKSLGRRFVAFFKGVVKGYYKPSIGKWVPQYTTRRTKKPEEVGQQRMSFGEEDAPQKQAQAPQAARPEPQAAKPEPEAPALDPAEDYRQNGTRAAAFKQWFGDWETDPEGSSKVVNEDGEPQETHSIPSTGSKVKGKDGKPVVVYHGTAYGGFTEFEVKRQAPESLYGPGFYFTEDQGVAESYQDKGHRIELVRDGVPAELGDAETESAMAYAAEKKKELKGKRGGVGWNDLHHTIKYTGLHRALQEYLDPETEESYYNLGVREAARELSEHLGITAQTTEPETKSLYLNIRKPFDMEAVIDASQKEQVAATLEKVPWGAVTAAEVRKFPDGIDGGRFYQLLHRTIVETVSDHYYNAGTAFYAIPRANSVLAKAGFDGITHIGGDRMGGGHRHRVWIAFEPAQIKAVENEGTFDPENADIRKGLGPADWTEDGMMAKSVLRWVAVFGDVAKSLRLLKGRVKAHYKPSIGKWIPTYTTKRPEAMQQAGQLSMFGEEEQTPEDRAAAQQEREYAMHEAAVADRGKFPTSAPPDTKPVTSGDVTSDGAFDGWPAMRQFVKELAGESFTAGALQNQFGMEQQFPSDMQRWLTAIGPDGLKVLLRAGDERGFPVPAGSWERAVEVDGERYARGRAFAWLQKQFSDAGSPNIGPQDAKRAAQARENVLNFFKQPEAQFDPRATPKKQAAAPSPAPSDDTIVVEQWGGAPGATEKVKPVKAIERALILNAVKYLAEGMAEVKHLREGRRGNSPEMKKAKAAVAQAEAAIREYAAPIQQWAQAHPEAADLFADVFAKARDEEPAIDSIGDTLRGLILGGGGGVSEAEAQAPTTDAPQAGAGEAPAKPRQFRGEECDEYTETIQKLAATAHNQMMGEVDSGKVNGTEVPEARLAELAGRGQGYRAVGDIFERIVSDIVDESDEGGWEGTAILSPDQVADAIERINAAAASIEHNADGSDATAYKQMVLRSGAAAIRDAADKLRQIATTGATPPAAPKGTLGDPDDDGPTVGDEFADDDDDGGWKPASMQEHFVAAHKAGRMDLWEKLAEAHVALRRAHEADRIYENDPEHSEGRKFEQARVDALKAAIKELGLKRPSGPKEVPASRIARAKIAHEKAQKRLDDAKRLDAGLFVKPDSPRYTEAAEENLRKRKQMHEHLQAGGKAAAPEDAAPEDQAQYGVTPATSKVPMPDGREVTLRDALTDWIVRRNAASRQRTKAARAKKPLTKQERGAKADRYDSEAGRMKSAITMWARENKDEFNRVLDAVIQEHGGPAPDNEQDSGTFDPSHIGAVLAHEFRYSPARASKSLRAASSPRRFLVAFRTNRKGAA